MPETLITIRVLGLLGSPRPVPVHPVLPGHVEAVDTVHEMHRYFPVRDFDLALFFHVYI